MAPYPRAGLIGAAQSGNVIETTTLATYAGFRAAIPFPASVTLPDFSYGQNNYASLGVNTNIYPNHSPLWHPGDRAFVSLIFNIGADDHAGWLDLSVNPDFTLTLHRMAYEDESETHLHAGGVIPEPAHLGLLAMGAAGVAALRRRRAARAEQMKLLDDLPEPVFGSETH